MLVYVLRKPDYCTAIISVHQSTYTILEEKYLITAAELKAKLSTDKITLIDTRDESVYGTGHIPGAVNIHRIFTYLATEKNGGLALLAKTFIEEFSAAGISENDSIVIYEDTLSNGFGQSGRGYFLLKYLGHKQVLVLDGGFAAWERAGFGSTAEVPVRERRTYHASIDESIVATKEQILNSLHDKNIILLDCRDKDEWIGESSSPYGKDFSPRKGRIPGAVWMEWYQLFDRTSGIPFFKTDEQILELCSTVDITKDSDVIIYCFKGSRASTALIAFKKAGIRKVRNYFASWYEWADDPSLPVDSGLLE
jgi:thiosulfate/3-mercaptopyruvate sulfurtransferase